MHPFAASRNMFAGKWLFDGVKKVLLPFFQLISLFWAIVNGDVRHL